MASSISKRIREFSQTNTSLYVGLLDAQKSLGDSILETFFMKISEKGNKLWERFQKFKEQTLAGGEIEKTGFDYFVTSIVMPRSPRQ